jgi:hypothetical protein
MKPKADIGYLIEMECLHDESNSYHDFHLDSPQRAPMRRKGRFKHKDYKLERKRNSSKRSFRKNRHDTAALKSILYEAPDFNYDFLKPI